MHPTKYRFAFVFFEWGDGQGSTSIGYPESSRKLM